MLYEDEKILTSSETKNIGVVEAFIIKTERKNGGGGQASYNLPNDFFKRLLDEGYLVEFSNKEYTRNGGRNFIYSLNNEYRLVLEPSVLKYVGENVINPRFLVTYGNGNKPQIRPSDYKSNLDKNDGFNYSWFITLYSKNLENNIMKYKLSTIDKTLSISIDEKHWSNYVNKVYEEDHNYDVIKSSIDKPHQRIFFGAPGTGKSYKLNEEAKEYFADNYERVTFHPNYMYGNFVGAFKPFPKVLKNSDGTIKKDEDGNIQESITYEYIPGVFMKQVVKALKNPNQNHLLLIEEINRANVASVFGDIFQLLDRDENGESEYLISTPMELQDFLKKEFSDFKLDERIQKKLGDDFSKLYLPSNFYIWASMNSADQGVMPMDTAFRRRWDFEYLGVNDSVNSDFDNYLMRISDNEVITWDSFRRSINKILSSKNIPEDKLLGPYFIPKAALEKSPEEVTKVVRNKVLMYLFEDAGKAYRNQIFKFVDGDLATFSTVCNKFDENIKTLFKDDLELVVVKQDIEENEESIENAPDEENS
ncbi:AAA family ATPase [Helcococcus ovis]|uniref:AAA family ATPase n=1 Tax=Helcococcus ovis TaxID=72026 RepID=UPI0010700082|nr:AAA family ATPase [Helcococcus ovis]TFF65021.1 hypothetical protein EQF92_03730 [Helcococcus ovis]